MRHLTLVTMFALLVGCRDRRPLREPSHAAELLAMRYDAVVNHFTRTCPGTANVGDERYQYWMNCTWDDASYYLFIDDRAQILNISLDFMTQAQMRGTFEIVVAPLLHDITRNVARQLINEIPPLPAREATYKSGYNYPAPAVGGILQEVESRPDGKIAISWKLSGEDPSLRPHPDVTRYP